MLTKTIGQLDSATIADATEYIEIEKSGASKKTTVQDIVYSGLPVGMKIESEFEEDTSVTWPAVPRNVDIDIAEANYPLLVPKLYNVKANILGVTDFTGVISSVNTSYSMITFVAISASTSLCTLLTEDAKVSHWFASAQSATSPATVDFTTSASSRCINIGGTDYPIYPSTSASAISITSGTIIFEGKPTSGTVSSCVYTYRIPGSTSVRLRKIAGFVGVAAGDAGGEVVGGFRKMDRGQGHRHEYQGTTLQALNVTLGASNYGYANITNSNTTESVSDGGNGTPRVGKTSDPRTAGQYVYTWAGVYKP